jgi:tetratricopeptide (TPR) repeat protein
MARPLFEQYKDALRRGHVALAGDELEAALAAYREAARLVTDRPLPYASMGAVLQRLGRGEEALAAYDRAVALAPDDEMIGAARAALVAGPALDPAASEPARTEPPERVPTPAPAAAAEALAEPEPELGPLSPVPAAPPDDEDSGAAAGAAAAAAALAEMTALDAMRAALVPEAERAERAEAVEAAEGTAPDAASEFSEAEPGEAPGEGGTWPAIDLPSLPPAPLVGPPPDPAILQAEAESLIDAGDDHGARDPLLLAVAVHRDAGRLDAALDSALQLLAIAPGDPRVHLAIANLQLDRGWRPVATEKIELLLRLTSLSGDAQAEADVHLLAAERLRDESPARLDARRRGIAAS